MIFLLLFFSAHPRIFYSQTSAATSGCSFLLQMHQGLKSMGGTLPEENLPCLLQGKQELPRAQPT